MKKKCVRSLSILTFTLALLALTSQHPTAQTTKASVAKKTNFHSIHQNAAAVSSSEPFKIGERLIYEAKYSRLLLRGIDVADLTFNVAAPASPTDSNKYQLKAEAVSKGPLLRLISYNFLQKFDSTVETNDFRILQTIRFDKQDKRVRNAEATFDYQTSKVTYREIDPQNPTAPPRIISSPIKAPVQDLVSAVYYLRKQPLAVGKQLTVNLSDSGVVYNVPVRIIAREKMQTVIGKVWTLQVEPEIFGERHPVAGEGKMTIWLTDDVRHLPVRAQISTSIGKFEIKLRQAENLQPVK